LEFAELEETLQIKVGVCQIGLVLLLLGLGLVERGLVGPGVNFGKQVALAHQLSFREGDFVDLAVDTRTNNNCVEGLDGPKAGQVDGKIGLLYRRHRYPHRVSGGFLGAVRRRFMALAVKALPAKISQPTYGQDQQNPTRYPRFVHFGPQILKIRSSPSSKRLLGDPDIICVHLMCKHTIA
jgi:hypothetical protein